MRHVITVANLDGRFSTFHTLPDAMVFVAGIALAKREFPTVVIREDCRRPPPAVIFTPDHVRALLPHFVPLDG